MSATTPPTVPNSPFFAPSTPHVVVVQQTPGGTRRPVRKPTEVTETKSGMLGCSANLMNAIVGSGIVGIPYAIKEAGFVAGIFLVVLCAIITEKSLRVLIFTAKHVGVPTYETCAEAAFGRTGFLFITISMFIMAYGAMLSYLMIVKDNFSAMLGVYDDPIQKRAVLLAISLLIMVPLSSQRDMADLAKTSRLNVVIDCTLVALVAYTAPIRQVLDEIDGGIATFFKKDTIHPETVFVGLGVLSFAYVCQHSSFIIAGSLERPTARRWSTVTSVSLTLCALLALTCGVSGYIGYGRATDGSILNNLDDSWSANLARGLLGITMLFVYPLESFVARHVLVVTLFTGRRAHDGEDANILSRRDRRIGLTVFLYLLAVLPAAIFNDMGYVLALTGAAGGSCLSYLGPGLVYLGVHGQAFLDLVGKSWLGSVLHRGQSVNNNIMATNGTKKKKKSAATESTPLVAGNKDGTQQQEESLLLYLPKLAIWCVLGFPIWCAIARAGITGLKRHEQDMALKSPHPSRIGDCARASTTSDARIEGTDDNDDVEENRPLNAAQHRQHSFNAISPTTTAAISPTTPDTLLEYHTTSTLLKSGTKMLNSPATTPQTAGLNVNQQIGKRLLEEQQQKKNGKIVPIEADPQADPPSTWDFLVAVFFIMFGALAFVVGIVSLFIKDQRRRR